MARKFLQPIDLTQLELLNPRMQQLASAPGSPVSGQFWYNTTNARPQWRGAANNDIYPFDTANTINTGVLRDGSGNFSAGTITASLTGTASNASQLNSQSASFYLARGNHTGTQTASTISDFDTQVRTNRLDQMAAPTASVSFNSQFITNVLDPINPQDAATKSYVDATASGLDIKGSVRVATAAALPAYSRTGNVITASANGALAAVDGVTLVLNDRLLLKNGVAGSDNGLYFVSQVGTGGTPFTLTRVTDADSSAEVTAGLYTFVEEGSTLADTGWVLTTNNPITLNTTALTFTQFSGAGTFIAGTGITISGNTISINTGYVGQTSITTLGTIATGTWQATAVAPQYGGTGVNGSSAANGTLLIGNGTGYTLATLTQGTNIAITNGAGTITIATGATVLTGTLVSGRVPFANGTQSLTDNAKMVFSATTGFNVSMGGSQNLTLGTGAGQTLTTGADNVYVGPGAGINANSDDNTGVGHNALGELTSGTASAALGEQAGASTNASRASYFGAFAGAGATGDSDSTAIGHRALFANTSPENTAVGAGASDAITSSQRTVSMGFNALGAGTTGVTDSTAIGHGSLIIATGLRNTAIGAVSGATTVAGTDNIFLGAYAGDSTASGSSNRFVVGSGTSSITTMFIGKGETHTAPVDVTFKGTSATGTNVPGASLTFSAGDSTGNSNTSAINFQTAPQGSSGAGVNTAVTRMTLNHNGRLSITGIDTAAASATLLATNSTSTSTSVALFQLSGDGGFGLGLNVYSTTHATLPVSSAGIAYNGTRIIFSCVGITTAANRYLDVNHTAGTVVTGSVYNWTFGGTVSVAPPVITTGVQTAQTITGAANTNMTLSTEVSDVVLNLARTVQWATGAITTQRAVRVMAPTYAFVAASTITNAATFAISGAPVQGTNATLTNTYALWVQGGISRFDGNLSINDAVNIVLGTTNGTQIGTGSTQKIGFYGTTPVVQQTGNISTALAALGLVTSGTLPFASLTTTPTTLAGYGITNGALNGAVTASGITMSTARILGRTTAATGAIEEISIGSGLSLSAGVLSATGGGTVAKYATSIGNGALTTFTVTHSLGTLDVTCTIFDNGTGDEVVTDVIHATTNTLTVNFAVAPTSNQYRVVVLG